MKVISSIVGIAAVATALVAQAGCSVVNGSNVPSFLASDTLTQIEISDDQTGQKGLASQDADNLNELLNVLHLGDIPANTRQDAAEPATSAYTLVAYDQAQVVWTIRVPDAPQSSHVYVRDAVHPANSGIYPLKQPINAVDIDAFIRKYPAT